MNSGILQLISAHIGVGEANATSAKTLQCVTCLDNRSLRICIEELRRSGCVICSDEKGYFKPSTLEEVRRYIRKESSRARSIFYTLRSARGLERDMIESEESGKGGANNG